MKNSANAKSSSGFDEMVEEHERHEPQGANDQVIVQCPRCQTKFAVDAELIDPVEAPRFHCSRCDNVFSLPEYNQSYLPFKELRGMNKPAAGERPETGRKNSRSLEIPKGLDSNFDSRAPHETSTWGEEPEQVSFSFFPKRENARPAYQGLSFSVAESQQTEKPAASLSEDFPAFSFANLTGDSREEQPVFDFKAPRPRTRREPRLSTFVIAPLLAFLSLLAGGAYYLRVHPALIERAAPLLWPSTPQPAPEGLLIKDTRFRTITLDDGGKARVVAGTLLNDSLRTLREMQLEALVFNEAGELLQRTRVSAASTLAGTRIKSLSPEMINRLQSGRSRKPFQLAPGEQLDFLVAVQGADLRDTAYYSVRVHSVRY